MLAALRDLPHTEWKVPVPAVAPVRWALPVWIACASPSPVSTLRPLSPEAAASAAAATSDAGLSGARPCRWLASELSCSDDRCAYNATCDAGTCKCKSAKQNIKTFCTTCLDPHFKMPTCDTCVPGRYGDTCAQECNCNGFPCDAQTGKCKCPVPQLAGSTCECECTGMEGGNCYDDEPTCQCNAGRCGKNCENNCSPEYGSCDKTTNQCVCKVPPASPNAECVPSDQAWMLRYR